MATTFAHVQARIAALTVERAKLGAEGAQVVLLHDPAPNQKGQTGPCMLNAAPGGLHTTLA